MKIRLRSLVLFVLLSVPLCAQKQPADLIIAGGMVVSMDAKRSIQDDAAIAIEGDTIVAIGTREQIAAHYQSAQTR